MEQIRFKAVGENNRMVTKGMKAYNLCARIMNSIGIRPYNFVTLKVLKWTSKDDKYWTKYNEIFDGLYKKISRLTYGKALRMKWIDDVIVFELAE